MSIGTAAAMDDNDKKHAYASMRVVYEDLPDLIEIETRVCIGSWGGVACAYVSPVELSEQANRLEQWSERPKEEATIELGADTGIGWTMLRFYPVDMAGHTVCHIQLATGDMPTNARTEKPWRLVVEVGVEPGLVQRFARDLRYLMTSMKGEAVLSLVSG